jgi:HPt (histidine-containing phosphotransfer) domain-containing protein
MSTRAQKMLQAVPEVLKPLMTDVCVALRESLAAAGHALARKDKDGARAAAHALKGAAMRFGLEELAALAARAEDCAASGNVGGASSALDGFSKLLEELETCVKAGQL